MYSSIPTYTKQNFQIFFGNMLVPDASFVGFEDLGDGWGITFLRILVKFVETRETSVFLGKDIRHVFYMGRLVPDVNALFFKVLGSGYAKDRDHVYFHGEILPDVNPFFFKPPENVGMTMFPPYPPVTTPTYIHPTMSHSDHVIVPIHPGISHSNPMITPMYPVMSHSNPVVAPVHPAMSHSNHMITPVYVHPEVSTCDHPTRTVAPQSSSTLVAGYSLSRNDSADCCILI